jgi:L-asparaginase
MQIRLLVTGGTFDKEYDEISGKLYFKDTHVCEMLRLGRAAGRRFRRGPSP